MSRKNTILVAVMINIGLLAILFFTATKQEEQSLPIDPSAFLVENEMVNTAIGMQEKQISTEPLVEETPIVHKLPEIVEQKGEESAQIAKLSTAKQGLIYEKIIVKKGDSLDKIAKIYNVSVDEIVQVNELKTTIIRIGQVLSIPINKTGKQPERKSLIIQGEFYTVKPGDNPWTIAMKHNLKVEDLLNLNNLDKDKAKKLRPGDKLRIR